MVKKHKVNRIHATKRGRSWIIQRDNLLAATSQKEAMIFGGITVGAKQFRDLIRLMPSEYLKCTANGRLEVETVKAVFRPKDGRHTASFTKPKHNYQFIALINGAWFKPQYLGNVVTIKPVNIK
jgi:hypothetical protein